MNYLQAIVLGLVQGVAEFLPISSSGHLALVELIFGASMADVDENALFNILLHIATLAAVIVAYWRDVRGMLAECGHMVVDLRHGKSLASRNIPTRRLILMIIIATLPLVLILPVHNLEERLNAYPWFIGLALLVTGTLLFFADRMPRGTKTERNMTIVDAVVIGLAQAVATLPGLSRSGTTIAAGMGCGLKREFAVKFSFLMSLLSVLGALLIELLDVIGGAGVESGMFGKYLVGMIVAGVTGYLSIRLLLRIIDKGRFGGFSWYCWIVGIVTIVLSFVL